MLFDLWDLLVALVKETAAFVVVGCLAIGVVVVVAALVTEACR